MALKALCDPTPPTLLTILVSEMLKYVKIFFSLHDFKILKIYFKIIM